MQFAHLVLLSAVSAPVEESKPSVANPPTALPTVVRVDTILAKETTAGFDDEKQEAFLAAFAIVSNLNPGDTETLEIRAVKKATPSIGSVWTFVLAAFAVVSNLTKVKDSNSRWCKSFHTHQ